MIDWPTADDESDFADFVENHIILGEEDRPAMPDVPDPDEEDAEEIK